MNINVCSINEYTPCLKHAAGWAWHSQFTFKESRLAFFCLSCALTMFSFALAWQHSRISMSGKGCCQCPDLHLLHSSGLHLPHYLPAAFQRSQPSLDFDCTCRKMFIPVFLASINHLLQSANKHLIEALIKTVDGKHCEATLSALWQVSAHKSTIGGTQIWTTSDTCDQSVAQSWYQPGGASAWDKSKKGNKYIITLSDYFSKWPEALWHHCSLKVLKV